MKFKSDIEVQAGLRDGSNDIGTAGQLLSSTGTITNWINQSDVVAAGATRVLIACKNTSGATITKGTPVYQTGNVGATDVIEVAEADALISTGYLPAIGLLETDLINNAFGHVVITGELLNITTSPIDGVVPVTGDTIYLKSGGGLTLTKPTGEGNAIQNLGLVGKVSGGNAGSLTVASIMRQNDVPNLPEGRIWIGDGNTIVSDTVYVDEPNNRVGIGTTTPSTDLEVSSTGVNGVDISQSASNASQSGRLFFTTNTASEGFALFNANGTFQVNSGGIPNDTSGTNRISIIGSTGNVGIGTTSPNAKLEVAGSTRITGNGLDVGYNNNGTNFIQIGNGRTTNGFAFIDLIGDTTYSDYGLRIIRNNLGANTSTEFIHRGTGIFNFNATQAADITFRTSNVERLRIKDYSGWVGIGTTSPSAKLDVVQSTAANGAAALHLIGPNTNPGLTSSVLIIEQGDGKKITMDGNDIDVSSGDLFINDYSKEDVTFGGQIKVTGGGVGGDSYFANGNVGIGTTNPNSKLQVGGEIDANGGDGYRINGKPWAYESASVLKLGDWDGEAFSTSIFDESSIETFKVKDQGVIINCDRTKATTYGSDASLVVGGNKFSPWGAGVVTLLNNDPTSQAGDSTGLIQFAIRDDQSTSAGYTSASINGSIDFAAGSGSSGGGILDFRTSAGALGGSPVTRMRINRLGNVGIGTTSPQAKLQVNGGVQLANDTAGASASKVGTFRYRTSGNNSYVDMCMQTGASTFAWVNIVTNSW